MNCGTYQGHKRCSLLTPKRTTNDNISNYEMLTVALCERGFIGMVTP